MKTLNILLFVVVLFFTSSTLNAEIIFFDNFEYYVANQYPTGNLWQNLYSGVTAKISTAYAFGNGSKSFYLEGYSNWSRIDGISLTYDNQVTYQVCVYVPDAQRGTIVGFFESQGNMAPSYNAVIFRNDGKICIHDSGKPDVELQSYNANHWYIITVSLDFTINKIDIYIDGQKKYSEEPRSSRSNCNTFALSTNNFSGSGTAVCYFDDVTILNNFIPTSEFISSFGDIWSFAYDWWYSKDRHRDGQYAETKLVVPSSISSQSEISLSIWNWYSQAAGSARCKVYISTTQQVTPTDDNHNLITWWVGNNVSLGTLVGEYDAINTIQLKNIDIADFIQSNPSQNYYIAIKNEGYADAAAYGIYISDNKHTPPSGENFIVSVDSAWDNDPNTNYEYPWTNINYIIGSPDGNYAYTNHPPGGNGNPTAILDFGETQSATGLKFWLDDPYGTQTNLHLWISENADGPWQHVGEPQNTGEQILTFTKTNARYVKLSHGQTTSIQEDGIDAILLLVSTEVNHNQKKCQITKGYFLFQNYPNPFNPTTTISYALPKASNVQLQIFDINGRIVKTLLDGNKSAGTHQIEWNSRDDLGNRVTSGIYICRMTAGKIVLHQKLILAK